MVVESGHGYKGSGAVLFNDILDIVGRSKGFLEDQQVVGDRLGNTDNVRKDGGKVQESYSHQTTKGNRSEKRSANSITDTPRVQEKKGMHTILEGVNAFEFTTLQEVHMREL